MIAKTSSPEANHHPETLAAHRQAIERVIRAMRACLDDVLTLEDMSEIAAISRFHFNRIFRGVVGIPPVQFLYALRLQRAKHLLLTTELTVTEICFSVGYNSLGSFVQRFTQLVGLSPTHFRRLAADRALTSNLEVLCRQIAGLSSPNCRRRVSGQIIAPRPVAGPIFIGLFPKHIPQGRPGGGTIITQPGIFQIEDAPPAHYYVFVAATDWPEHHLGYLLPDEEELQVGVSRRAIQVCKGACIRGADVELRPIALTDPPILIALPLLIAERMGGGSAGEPFHLLKH